MKHAIRFYPLYSLLLLFFICPQLAEAQHGKRADIIDTAVSAGTFNTLAAALTEAELVKTLKGKGPFTVFAPTDEAFSRLPEGTVETLLKPENRDQLIAILTYHVINDRVRAEEVAGSRNLKTINGQQIDLGSDEGQILVNEARVITADIRASNGIIHVIDRVLLPESNTIPEVAKAAGSFKTLLAAVQTAGLSDALAGPGPFTVFAPTDEAFGKLPSGTVDNLLKPENRGQLQRILSYHVVKGRVFSDTFFRARALRTLADEKIKTGFGDGGFQINEVNVIAADIDAANGVIHVIDEVLLPEQGEMAMSEATAIIRLAIEKGVPLFNRGDAEACAAIYQIAATSILALPSADEAVKAPLRRALARIENTHDASKQAWMLREGLDEGLSALKTMMTAGR